MFLEPQLGRVVEQAVHCATSTGLCEVQGILPHLPVAVTGLSRNLPVCYESRELCHNTKRVKSRRPRLDAGPLVDPAPVLGIVFVAVVLEDTAALVVLQEILSETGLRHRARF